MHKTEAGEKVKALKKVAQELAKAMKRDALEPSSLTLPKDGKWSRDGHASTKKDYKQGS